MVKPNILIAAKDFALRMQLVRIANNAGYQVKTTLSVAKLLCTLLRKDYSVVLLSDSIEGNLQIPHLVRLTRAASSHVAIILISDDISLQQMRTARQQGIFYHALRPVTFEDWQELALAMSCAAKKTIRPGSALQQGAASLLPRIH